MRGIIAVVVILACLGWAYHDFVTPRETAVKICSRQEFTPEDNYYRVKTTAGDFKFHNTAPDERASQMYAQMPVGATVILKHRGNKLLGKFVSDVTPAAGKTPNC